MKIVDMKLEQENELHQFFQLTKVFKEKQVNIKDCQKKMQKMMEAGIYKIYLAKENDEVLGGCVIYIHEDPFDDTSFATLWYLTVKPSAQGRGVATYILQEVPKLLSKMNIRSLRLTTASNNFPCQTCCEKNNYEKNFSYKKEMTL